MAEYSVEEFVKSTAQDSAANRPFELENPHLLEVNLKGRVWAKTGSMVAYTGQVKFTREGVMEHGLGKMLKKMATGEGTNLMKVEGQGRVYLAEKGKKVQVLSLGNETIFVNGNDLLAFEDVVKWDITMMRRMAGLMTGGLFNVRLTGPGMVAITTHYEPLTLQVVPDQPIFTDPNATVAWSGSLSPDIRTDISLGTLLGRGSGESLQLKFAGTGWVVVQPYEEVYLQTGQGS
ncbi:MAG: AIM24 family protein [Desulfobulbaceae bacterium]|nr:AIM24 family protein [Desulfobulbaceae bacterium]